MDNAIKYDTLRTDNFTITINHPSFTDDDRKNIKASCKVVNVDATCYGDVVDLGFIRYKGMKLWSLFKSLKDRSEKVILTLTTTTAEGDPEEDIVCQSFPIMSMSVGHQCGNGENSSFFIKFGGQGVEGNG